MKQFFYQQEEKLAHNLAQQIVGDLKRDIDLHGHGFLILPGGRSPRVLIHHLAQVDLDWRNVSLSASDERCVSMESQDSNSGQMRRLFAEGGVDVRPRSLWPLPHEASDMNYASTIMVLGMGIDGHFASLFTVEDIKRGGGSYFVKTRAPLEPRDRISLSYQTILQTKRIYLLVHGEEKWTVCERIIAGMSGDLPLAYLFADARDKLELHILRV